jgi:hypothetical protein
MNDDHIPVPSEHSPRKEAHYAPQAMTDMIVEEVENEDAWISMDIKATVPVER